ncbi:MULTISPECIES: c-type cytochrome [unclassified Halomonas]|uniref:c-type cytochrome n=1 Tax=unclassified Halomonas TaxID=2609666 RepID=UPI003FB90AA1
MTTYRHPLVLALTGCSLAVGVGISVYATSAFAQQEERPDAALNMLIHEPPTMEDLENSDLHPELKKVIRYGHDLFTNTQQLRDEYVYNDMNCSSCHLGEGRVPFSAPVWAAAITLPDFRGKNQHVNNLEERIAGCFAYSMNGVPPEYGSDEMLALSAYHQWLATGAPMYPDKPIYGRGFPAPEEPAEGPSYVRGETAYQENCALCHQENGAGHYENDEYVFPAPWGDGSNNWGAGIARLETMAGFIYQNMPLGQPRSLSDQQAWDIAYYITSQERPQDPRYTGDVAETAERFHGRSLYGQTREHDGHVLGDHNNFGEKGDIKPWNVGMPRFENLTEEE